MKRIFYFVAFIISNLPIAGYAQKELEEANSLYEKLAFSDAIPKYKEVLNTFPSLLVAKTKLADCYRLTGNYVEAEKWYAMVANQSRSTDLDRFHYGQMLMNNGKYDEAKKWLLISQNERPSDERASNYIKSIDEIERLFSDSISYSIENIDANGTGNDFSPAFFANGIVITSSSTDIPKSKTHAWTGESFTKLTYIDFKNKRSRFAPEVESKFNDGPVSFASQNDMYSTINTMKANNTKTIYKLNIIHSTLENQRWTKPVPFEYNNPAYNVAHPAISSDGTRIYFSSDMPGGEGGMDLYYCDWANDHWNKPVNLGKDINTPGNEVFPFVHADGTLYFASNGHEGIGGLDVYVSSFSEEWHKPIALPYPINTRFDDFGLIFDHDKSTGYFSSNRTGGKGGDDIYKFRFTPSVLRGVVINSSTHEPVTDIEVEVRNIKSGKSTKIKTDHQGRFDVSVSPCQKYNVTATSEDYFDAATKDVQTSCSSTEVDLVELFFSNPTLTVEVVDKYNGKRLDDVFIDLKDTDTKKVIKQGVSSDFSKVVEPCHEYLIIAQRQGLPEVRTYFKSTCKSKNETVKILMGLPPADPSLISGFVFDQDTKRPLDSAALVVYSTNNIPLATVTSAGDGSFAITGFKNIDRIVFFRNGYFSVTKVLKDESNKKNIMAELPKLQLDKIIKLEGIYYDLGKFTIRADAARVLDNVIKVMNENPTLVIELGAHTDSRGQDDTNLILSDKRAKAAAAYIISKGISAERVVGKGYGESVLKNSCGNGVKCSEKQHQENRRTEVKITRY